MITPSITVLSAVEGLEVATPVFKNYIVPVTITVLIILFAFQKIGTEKVGRIFGPVMMLWFLSLAVAGLSEIVSAPGVAKAFNPAHALQFFRENGVAGFVVLGAVFLVLTGGEALYADMGHFGWRPIRLAWFVVVLPALVLNYLGQGALLLSHPEFASNPFYNLFPGWSIYPMVTLATAAGVIAS